MALGIAARPRLMFMFKTFLCQSSLHFMFIFPFAHQQSFPEIISRNDKLEFENWKSGILKYEFETRIVSRFICQSYFRAGAGGWCGVGSLGLPCIEMEARVAATLACAGSAAAKAQGLPAVVLGFPSQWSHSQPHPRTNTFASSRSSCRKDVDRRG